MAARRGLPTDEVIPSYLRNTKSERQVRSNGQAYSAQRRKAGNHQVKSYVGQKQNMRDTLRSWASSAPATR